MFHLVVVQLQLERYSMSSVDFPRLLACHSHSAADLDAERRPTASRQTGEPCPATLVLLQIQGLLSVQFGTSQYPSLASQNRDEGHGGARMGMECYLKIKDRQFQLATELNLKIGSCGWSILADLYIAEQSDRRITVSSLCIGARAPATTALRHIGSLVEQELIVRHEDDYDGRIVNVSLTDAGRDAICRAFV